MEVAVHHLRLEAITTISPDTKVFRFAFADPLASLNIPCGHHIAAVATMPTPSHPEGKKVKRKYTPISRGDQVGYCDLLVKVYYPCEQFPTGGLMTQYMDRMKLGDELEFVGPRGKVTYHGEGRFTLVKLDNRQVQVREVAMVAGGSGIAPMYQLIRYIVDHNEAISLYLVFGNKTEADILLRPELEALASAGKLHLWFTLDTASDTWTQGRGYVTKEMLQAHLPSGSADALVLISGPSPMNRALRTTLPELGYEPVVKF